MTVSIGLLFDIVKLAAGIALTYFAFFLYQREFRSGVMEKGFRYIAISTLILTAGRSVDFLSLYMPKNELLVTITPILATAFSLVASYGFYLLYQTWHIDRKSVPVEKSISVQPTSSVP